MSLNHIFSLQNTPSQILYKCNGKILQVTKRESKIKYDKTFSGERQANFRVVRECLHEYLSCGFYSNDKMPCPKATWEPGKRAYFSLQLFI